MITRYKSQPSIEFKKLYREIGHKDFDKRQTVAADLRRLEDSAIEYTFGQGSEVTNWIVNLAK